MAISYPLSMPTVIGMSQFRLQMRNAVSMTESPFTFRQQVQKYDGQRWEASVVIPPVHRETAEQFNAFLAALNGKFGTFLLGDPNATTPRGSVAGAPVINGAAQTGQTLNLRGFTPNSENVLRAGDFIQLGSFSTARLYKVLNDVDSDVSGLASVDIWPRIRLSPADGDPIITTNAVGVFRLAENINGYDINVQSQYSVSFTAIEVIQ